VKASVNAKPVIITTADELLKLQATPPDSQSNEVGEKE
jgi:hypothetical protein